jgi:hypothetical protein
LAVVLVLISALTALGFLALNAYAPDLRSDRTGKATVVSKSAIGFAGLRVLLENLHATVDVGREPPAAGAFSLVILTPEPSTDAKELAALGTSEPRLIVLPKWIVGEQAEHLGWVTKVAGLLPPETAKMLRTLDKDAALAQRKGIAKTKLTAEMPAFEPDWPVKPVAIDQLQTISGPNIEPVIVDDNKHAVLARVRNTQTYILAEPDLLNNQGLADRNTASIGYWIVQGARVGDGPISFDVTLDGFKRSPDLLRAVFSPPFLGATLCVLLAAAFLGFHAMSRFGSPRAPDRVYAFGKRALADNTAAVIRMMRREPAMAPRYAQAVLHQAGAFFGIGRDKAADPATMRALEARSPVPYRFADLSAEARGARNAQGLMQVARKLFRWRRTITHGHL